MLGEVYLWFRRSVQLRSCMYVCMYVSMWVQEEIQLATILPPSRGSNVYLLFGTFEALVETTNETAYLRPREFTANYLHCSRTGGRLVSINCDVCCCGELLRCQDSAAEWATVFSLLNGCHVVPSDTSTRDIGHCSWFYWATYWRSLASNHPGTIVQYSSRVFCWELRNNRIGLLHVSQWRQSTCWFV